MKKEQVKQKLLEAAKELLLELESPDEITTRKIAAKAGINPAMVNYCYESKNQLINDAIGRIILENAENGDEISEPGVPAIRRLWKMLWRLVSLVMKFEKFTKITIPYVLLQSEIETPLYILPLVREHFGAKKSETECRMIAYQLISFVQLVFYRSDAIQRYCGMDVMNPAQAEQLLEWEFRLLLQEDFVRE